MLNGVTTYDIGAVEIAIAGAQRITKTHYSLGGQLAALRVISSTGNVLYYLHGDHLGSVSLVTNQAQAVVSRQMYSPYGTVRWSQGAPPTDIGFTGQRADATGLMFYQARYYSAALGRFIQADTIVPSPANPQSLNRYSYVLNSPLRYTDPTGHYWCPTGSIHCIDDTPPPRSPSSDPNTRYYYSEKYGWFDRSHTGTGKPKDIIQQVRQFIADGGGVISISQDVRAGPITLIYQGRYQISGEARPEDAIGIAYGIYQDWSHRFEAWQGTIAFGRGKNTSFAIEDLPSHHIGFYTAAYHVSVPDVFEALGGVESTDAEPPRNVKNHTFEPVVKNAEGQYERVPWPSWMTVTPIGSGQNTWTFVDDRCEGVFCFLSGW
ncbi:MAG: RHS repeat-associated core domain-containing protein [Anaerolineae bacterium]